jgi:hypothetical protein
MSTTPSACGMIQRCAGSLAAKLLSPARLRQARWAATPDLIKDWSLTTLKEKLIKIGRQMAEVAVPRNLFADILRMIAELRSPPIASTT